MSDEMLLRPSSVLKVGRKRTLHQLTVDIAAGKVIVLTRCGIPWSGPPNDVIIDGFPTCEACEERTEPHPGAP